MFNDDSIFCSRGGGYSPKENIPLWLIDLQSLLTYKKRTRSTSFSKKVFLFFLSGKKNKEVWALAKYNKKLYVMIWKRTTQTFKFLIKLSIAKIYVGKYFHWRGRPQKYLLHVGILCDLKKDHNLSETRSFFKYKYAKGVSYFRGGIVAYTKKIWKESTTRILLPEWSNWNFEIASCFLWL